MAKVITDGRISIGASMIPGRKKVALIIQDGNAIKVYGYFSSKELANEFMDRIGELCHAKRVGDTSGDA